MYAIFTDSIIFLVIFILCPFSGVAMMAPTDTDSLNP